jgi:hypothetical protein
MDAQQNCLHTFELFEKHYEGELQLIQPEQLIFFYLLAFT